MPALTPRALLLGIAFALFPCPAQPAAPPVVADIDASRPAVLAFVPVSAALVDGTDAALAQALAAEALVRANVCLGDAPVVYQLLRADRIVVHDGTRAAAFDIADGAPLAGALLVAPGTNPSVLFAGGGPGSLARLLPQAAGEFFHHACRR